ncbi:hypothetical protein BKA83DRAFT_4481259 [Pisolithus microcarpus]|nr:hypothetical protein BKA83DRAFT_4481259 [Pisolithus microcarpus]
MDASAGTCNKQSECWVIIGGDKPGIYQACPTLHCGRSSPPLPIAIQCLSLTEAKMINECFQAILQQLPCQPHTRELLTCLGKSDAVLNLLSDSTGTFYAVVVGQQVGIHRTRESALSSLDGFVFLYWKELPTFWDALAFMIAKGIEDILSDTPNYKGVACTTQSTVPVTLSSTSEDTLTPAVPSTLTPAVNNSSSTTTHCNPSMSQDVPCSSRCPIIYTHVCNLCGVMESRFYMSDWEPPTESAAEVLGIHTVKYLEAHGYVESAVAHIVVTYWMTALPRDRQWHYGTTARHTTVQLHNCETHNCTTAQLRVAQPHYCTTASRSNCETHNCTTTQLRVAVSGVRMKNFRHIAEKIPVFGRAEAQLSGFPYLQ